MQLWWHFPPSCLVPALKQGGPREGRVWASVWEAAMGSPAVLGGGGRALLPNLKVSVPHGPQLPGQHPDPGQGAVHGHSGCPRGCGGPWQRAGAWEGPWHTRLTAPGPGALGCVCTPSPAPTLTPSPSSSLPGGWLGQDQPRGACLYLPRAASPPTWRAALALSSQWGDGGGASGMEGGG